MPALHRRAADPSTMTPAVFKLLIALVVLFFLATVLAIAILVLRLKRARSAAGGSPRRGHRLTIETVSHAQLSEKRSLMDTPPASPPLTLPEIRITFPDEDSEKGRVVVVRMGDNAVVGLGPVDEEHEQLPPYPADGERFQSLDLERIGGLKEKTDKRFS